MSIHTNKLAAFAMGQVGPEIVTGTGSGTAGPWVAISMVADTTFTSITINGSTGAFNGAVFPQGYVLYGAITAFTLTSGTCVAYKGSLHA